MKGEESKYFQVAGKMIMKFAERIGLAVWVKDLKAARSLERLGNVHYISKRLHYVYLYVDGKNADQLISRIEQMPFVYRVEPSQRRSLSWNFSNRICPEI
ncbi:YlbG family protein [Thermoflavimicrobium dichotomicum]|uniref:Uncharacterized protein YlbG, UPF0298 family n=1 Tax=Thermoflavimicrobium dichotomicum TaxID=46223 RepID=A0A1I3MQ28_9BACL|nr:YlbG family protein [Thermoflavimicrobium dichotomicum]SFI99059.1 Uncharacterized protein YlbG, UPF0298 family [Thermoflavimicrobium dichotomicum]